MKEEEEQKERLEKEGRLLDSVHGSLIIVPLRRYRSFDSISFSHLNNNISMTLSFISCLAVGTLLQPAV